MPHMAVILFPFMYGVVFFPPRNSPTMRELYLTPHTSDLAWEHTREKGGEARIGAAVDPLQHFVVRKTPRIRVDIFYCPESARRLSAVERRSCVLCFGQLNPPPPTVLTHMACLLPHSM